MRRQTMALSLLLLAGSDNAFSAERQSSPANYLQRPTIISVQYMIRLPLKSDDTDEQQRVMEEGRKQLYVIGSKECATILATLASKCTLSSLNVQSNLNRQRSEDNSVTLSASAQYQVELKDAQSTSAR